MLPEPLGDLLKLHRTRAKHQLCLVSLDGYGVACPAQLVEIVLLRPAIRGGLWLSASAKTRQEELRFDGGSSEERQKRWHPGLQAVADQIDDDKPEKQQTPEPKRTKRHHMTVRCRAGAAAGGAATGTRAAGLVALVSRGVRVSPTSTAAAAVQAPRAGFDRSGSSRARMRGHRSARHAA